MSMESKEIFGMSAQEAAERIKAGTLPGIKNIRIVFEALNEMVEPSRPVLWITEEGKPAFALNVSPAEVEMPMVGQEWVARINSSGEIFKHR